MARKLRVEYAGACYHGINRATIARICLPGVPPSRSSAVWSRPANGFGWRLHAFVNRFAGQSGIPSRTLQGDSLERVRRWRQWRTLFTSIRFWPGWFRLSNYPNTLGAAWNHPSVRIAGGRLRSARPGAIGSGGGANPSGGDGVRRKAPRGLCDETHHLSVKSLARSATGDGKPDQCRAADPSFQPKWRSGYARIQRASVSILGLTPFRPP